MQQSEVMNITYLSNFPFQSIKSFEISKSTSSNIVTVVDSKQMAAFEIPYPYCDKQYLCPIELNDLKTRTVKKYIFIRKNHYILTDDRKFVIETPKGQQIQQKDVEDYFISNNNLILIIFNVRSSNGLSVIVINTQDLFAKQQYQFAEVTQLLLITQTFLITDQYLIRFDPSHQSKPQIIQNSWQDQSLDKQYLDIDHHYVIYRMGNTTYAEKYRQGEQVVKIETKSDSMIIWSRLAMLLVLQEKDGHLSVCLYSLKNGVKVGQYATQFQESFLLRVLQEQVIFVLEVGTLRLLRLQLSRMIGNIYLLEKQIHQEEEKHENIIKTLQYRKKQLASIQRYLENHQFDSATRILLNQQNSSVVNDGTRLIHANYCLLNTPMHNIETAIITLCQSMINSKYQHHIQNGLTILIKISQNTQNLVIKNQLIESLKTKRIQKLLQSKKKLLFELTYQFKASVEKLYIHN